MLGCVLEGFILLIYKLHAITAKKLAKFVKIYYIGVSGFCQSLVKCPLKQHVRFLLDREEADEPSKRPWREENAALQVACESENMI